MKYFIFSFFLISICASVIAQPQIDWQHTFGGSETDGANYVVQTDDGGYIIVGYSESEDGDLAGNAGIWDVWIVKLFQNGELDWQRTLGGSNYETARVIQQTSDGGYVLTGWTRSSDGDVASNAGGNDLWVVKLNSAGDIVWETTYGSMYSDKAHFVIQTNDNGFAVAGVNGADTNGGILILKLNEQGELEWERVIEGIDQGAANTIIQTSDDAFMVVGETRPSIGGNLTFFECVLLRLNSAGEVEWLKTYSNSFENRGNSIVETLDGSFVIAGSSKVVLNDIIGGNEKNDVWVFKVDVSGEVIWEKTFGGAEEDFAISISETDDAGYILACNSATFDESPNTPLDNFNTWVIKLTIDGDLYWEKRFGGSGDDFCNRIVQTEDRGYIAVGFSHSADGDFGSDLTFRNLWVMKLLPVRLTDTKSEVNSNILVFPNPAFDKLFIDHSFENGSYQIVNKWGQKINEGILGEGNTSVDIAHLTLGFYSLIIQSNDDEKQIKFVKI